MKSIFKITFIFRHNVASKDCPNIIFSMWLDKNPVSANIFRSPLSFCWLVWQNKQCAQEISQALLCSYCRVTENKYLYFYCAFRWTEQGVQQNILIIIPLLTVCAKVLKKHNQAWNRTVNMPFQLHDYAYVHPRKTQHSYLPWIDWGTRKNTDFQQPQKRFFICHDVSPHLKSCLIIWMPFCSIFF